MHKIIIRFKISIFLLPARISCLCSLSNIFPLIINFAKYSPEMLTVNETVNSELPVSDLPGPTTQLTYWLLPAFTT